MHKAMNGLQSSEYYIDALNWFYNALKCVIKIDFQTSNLFQIDQN